MAEGGNLFLSNIHRVFQSDREPSFEDDDTIDYFLGRRPSGKTTDSQVDLGFIVRQVPDLVVLNDEAHHIHDPKMAWFKNIEDISNQLRLKGSKLSVQFDLTATPKHNNGAIFVQTIADYPLVEAIRQRVVKTPVLPDEASRAKLHEPQSDRFVERYEDYLHLGYLEWKKVYQELLPTGKKAVMFVMTDDTRHCDEVKEYLLSRYSDLQDAVLVIHTKNNGEISEAATGKSKEELDRLRKESREIDDFDDPNKAIVSVMMLREGWDVQNVVTIVGLRAYGAKSGILPEQTLGRGLRRMFRGEDVPEKVSVVGTAAFMDFVESIREEGVEFEYAEMGERTPPKSPLVVEVDQRKTRDEIERLDIALPVLAPRLYREFKNLNDLDVAALPHKRVALKQFSEEEQREIQFRDIDSGRPSHVTLLNSLFEPDYQSVVAYFARTIMRDLHLVGGFDVLFGKIKAFIEQELFNQEVALADANVLRNLSEPEATRTLLETLKAGVNTLTVQDRGTTELRHQIKLSETRPFLVKDQRFIAPRKCFFNKVTGDNDFELAFAAFLEGCNDIVSFAQNSQSIRFRIEYRSADGSIANYYPDFLVKQSDRDLWLIETKGRADLQDPLKWERLQQWGTDATELDPDRTYNALFVRQETWEEYRPTNFASLVSVCRS